MSVTIKSVYTLMLWLAATAIIGGCGGGGNSAAPQSETASEADTEIPTVTLPDTEAGESTDSASDEDASK